MYLFGKRTEHLDEHDIKRLIQNKIPENKTLDYKRELKFSQDKDRKEFLFDLTSMANTDGGCFIYGIEESKNEKEQNTGTPEKIVGISIANYDKLVQQIEDIVKGNTEPSISSIALKLINIEGKSILIIGVSKTLGLPIMVTFHETNKFFRRRNSGKYSVDIYELNQMFMQNQVLKESVEKFRWNRIEKVKALKVFPNLELLSPLFIHIIPFSFQNEQSIDIANADSMNLNELMKPMNAIGWDRMFNVYGYSHISTNQEGLKINSYDQLFRTGIYEIYTSEILNEENVNRPQPIRCLYGQSFISEILEKIDKGLAVLKKFQIEPPFVISFSLHGLKGGVIKDGRSWSRKFMEEEIYLPSIVIPAFETDVYNYLKPNFDIVWQAVGNPHSPSRQI